MFKHGVANIKGTVLIVQEFKSGKHPIMLATDVAARGLGRMALLALQHFSPILI